MLKIKNYYCSMKATVIGTSNSKIWFLADSFIPKAGNLCLHKQHKESLDKVFLTSTWPWNFIFQTSSPLLQGLFHFNDRAVTCAQLAKKTFPFDDSKDEITAYFWTNTYGDTLLFCETRFYFFFFFARQQITDYPSQTADHSLLVQEPHKKDK